MNEETTSSNPLTALLDTGARIHEALLQGDIDAFAVLVQERGELVDKLRAYDHPADVDPRWRATAAALAEQYQAILQAATTQEQRLGAAAQTTQRFKQAHRSYTAPSEPRPSRARLHG